MAEFKEAVFIAGPGIPTNRHNEILMRASLLGKEARDRGLIVVNAFPLWSTYDWCGFVPNMTVCYGEHRRLKTLGKRFAFYLGMAAEVYAFAVARTYSQKNWINMLFDRACGLDVKLYLQLY